MIWFSCKLTSTILTTPRTDNFSQVTLSFSVLEIHMKPLEMIPACMLQDFVQVFTFNRPDRYIIVRISTYKDHSRGTYYFNIFQHPPASTLLQPSTGNLEVAANAKEPSSISNIPQLGRCISKSCNSENFTYDHKSHTLCDINGIKWSTRGWWCGLFQDEFDLPLHCIE